MGTKLAKVLTYRERLRSPIDYVTNKNSRYELKKLYLPNHKIYDQ